MDQDLQTILDSRKDTPILNEWCSNFTLAKQYADDRGIPLMAVISQNGSYNCRIMEKSFLQKDFTEDWMNKSQIYFYFAHIGEESADRTAAKDFIYKGTMTPMAKIWWSSNGQVKVNTHYIGGKLAKNATTLKNKFQKALADYDKKPPTEPTK